MPVRVENLFLTCKLYRAIPVFTLESRKKTTTRLPTAFYIRSLLFICPVNAPRGLCAAASALGGLFLGSSKETSEILCRRTLNVYTRRKRILCKINRRARRAAAGR